MDSRTKRIFLYTLAAMAITVLVAGGKKVVQVIDQTFRGQFKQKMLDAIASVGLVQNYVIQPNIALAQASLESGWGQSGLSKTYNNIFGWTGDTPLSAWLVSKNMPADTSMDWIRAQDLSAQTFVILQTTEYSLKPPSQVRYFVRPGDVISVKDNGSGGSVLTVYRPFYRFNSWADALRVWAQRISTSSRYASAYEFAKVGDVANFALAVAQAGYATENPQTYANDVVARDQEIGAIV